MHAEGCRLIRGANMEDYPGVGPLMTVLLNYKPVRISLPGSELGIPLGLALAGLLVAVARLVAPAVVVVVV